MALLKGMGALAGTFAVVGGATLAVSTVAMSGVRVVVKYRRVRACAIADERQAFTADALRHGSKARALSQLTVVTAALSFCELFTLCIFTFTGAHIRVHVCADARRCCLLSEGAGGAVHLVQRQQTVRVQRLQRCAGPSRSLHLPPPARSTCCALEAPQVLRDQQLLVLFRRGLRPGLEPDPGAAGEAVGRVPPVRRHRAAGVPQLLGGRRVRSPVRAATTPAVLRSWCTATAVCRKTVNMSKWFCLLTETTCTYGRDWTGWSGADMQALVTAAN